MPRVIGDEHEIGAKKIARIETSRVSTDHQRDIGQNQNRHNEKPGTEAFAVKRPAN
jgi:hypothetical protein